MEKCNGSRTQQVFTAGNTMDYRYALIGQFKTFL